LEEADDLPVHCLMGERPSSAATLADLALWNRGDWFVNLIGKF